MVLGKLFRIKVVVIGENIAHLGHIVADGHRRTGLRFEKGGQLQKIILCRIIEDNGPQGVFF